MYYRKNDRLWIQNDRSWRKYKIERSRAVKIYLFSKIYKK